MRRLAPVLMIVAAAFTCRAGDEQTGEASDDPTAAAADHVMAHAGAMEADPHMRLTPPRAPAPGDSARAAAIVATMRRDLARYHDVRAAEADGFRQFLPGAAAPIQHFTKLSWAFEARRGLNPSHPTSLLYRRTAAGSLELVGAMFTAPPGSSDDELDARFPLSVVRWHQHVNWCVPPLRARWRETRDGHPVFGPKSPIATAEACAAVGGRFLPRLFGWMVHVEF